MIPCISSLVKMIYDIILYHLYNIYRMVITYNDRDRYSDIAIITVVPNLVINLWEPGLIFLD